MELSPEKKQVRYRILVDHFRERAHHLHAAAAWGFDGDGYLLNEAADIIEKELLNEQNSTD